MPSVPTDEWPHVNFRTNFSFVEKLMKVDAVQENAIFRENLNITPCT
jgi:predicted small integral membrane protein